MVMAAVCVPVSCHAAPPPSKEARLLFERSDFVNIRALTGIIHVKKMPLNSVLLPVFFPVGRGGGHFFFISAHHRPTSKCRIPQTPQSLWLSSPLLARSGSRHPSAFLDTQEVAFVPFQETS